MTFTFFICVYFEFFSCLLLFSCNYMYLFWFVLGVTTVSFEDLFII